MMVAQYDIWKIKLMKNFTHKKLSHIPALAALCATIFSGSVIAGPSVSGNVISWTDEGWHQVQVQGTYESLCQGGRQCTVPTGVYIVINHSTGERFENIPVGEEEGDSAPAPVAATGQVISYGFGDDGDYQSGVSVAGVRFQDNSDGTFTDTLTGLVWLGIRDCFVRRDWPGALDRANTMSANSDSCPALTDGSVAGEWRLPNVKELYSLVDITADTALFSSSMPFSGDWNESPFENYWSSSSFRPVPETTGWAVEPNFGRPEITLKTNLGIVWPVRVGN